MIKSITTTAAIITLIIAMFYFTAPTQAEIEALAQTNNWTQERAQFELTR